MHLKELVLALLGPTVCGNSRQHTPDKTDAQKMMLILVDVGGSVELLTDTLT
jgi:hypothetical protein